MMEVTRKNFFLEDIIKKKIKLVLAGLYSPSCLYLTYTPAQRTIASFQLRRTEQPYDVDPLNPIQMHVIHSVYEI